jgi:hypothetical protein
MGSRERKSLPALGFLTVVEYEQHGFLGGYLVLNASGRPVEFHCTAPVKPNRAQEILYGPTLEPYVYGEQIAQALVKKSQLEPLIVCTDLTPVLAVREFVSCPVALVVSSPAPETTVEANVSGRVFRVDRAHAPATAPKFRLGRNELAVGAAWAADEQRIAETIAELADHFDLAEPFARIRGAIDEAQRSGR